jgi:hypothetical protein
MIRVSSLSFSTSMARKALGSFFSSTSLMGMVLAILGSGLPFSSASIWTMTRAWLACPSVVVTTTARNTPDVSPWLQLPPLTISVMSVGTAEADFATS